jgi:hypothetical protein
VSLRRLALLGAAVVVAAVGAEVGTRVYDRLSGRPFDAEASRAARRKFCDALALESALPEAARKHTGAREPKLLSPYVGWELASTQIRIAGEVEYYRAPTPEVFDVCVLGGSAAGAVADAIAQDERLRARHVRVHDYSVAGYKQPQTTMLLAWLFALGHRPDAVVEIDGKDEVLLAETNAAAGTNPGYPAIAAWADAAGGMRSDWELVERMHASRAAREHAKAFGEWFLDSGLWRSCVVDHLATLRLRRLDEERIEARNRVEEYVRARPADVELRGPAFDRGASEVEDEIVSTWERASRSLAAMCSARGIPFVLVLAPAEPGAPDASASLRTAGEMVTGKGSRFLDLSGLDSAGIVPAIAKALFADTER